MTSRQLRAGVLVCCGCLAALPAQARLVADLAATPGPVAGQERELAVFAGAVYYAAHGTTGVELYRRPLGGGPRRLVKDIMPGAGSSEPFAFTPLGAQLFFAANDGQHGIELWRTDGSTANTVMVGDLHPGLASSMWPVASRREPMGTYRGALYFGASDGRRGRSLWRSDGTAAGTVLIKDLHPGRAVGPLGTFIATGGGLLFSATGASEQQLWSTDGTTANTRPLVNLRPRRIGASDRPQAYVHTGNAVYVGGLGAIHRITWPGGVITRRSVSYGADEHVPFCRVDPSGQPGSGGVLFGHRATLLYTDGLQTVSMGLRFGLASYQQRGAALPVESCFFGFDLQHGNELWKSDGTVAGTRLLRDIRPGPLDAARPGAPTHLETSGGGFYFAADDGVHGTELWFSDGSSQGTHLVSDLNPGAVAAQPRRLTAAGTAGVVFVADHASHGESLWYCAGPTVAPLLLDAGFAGVVGASPDDQVRGLFGHAGMLYFAADDGRTGSELWRSDGTAAGTRLVQDLHASGSALRDHDLRRAGSPGALQAVRRGNEFWFTAYQPGDRLALFASAGTSATTRRIAGLIRRDSHTGHPLIGVAVDDTLLFGAFDEQGGGLWRSAGSAATTQRVRSGVDPDAMLRLGRRVLFSSRQAGTTSVYASDGTTAGTRRLARWAGVAAPVALARVGRRVCFGGDGSLWSTDATVAGTRRLAPAAVQHLAAAAGRMLVLGYSSSQGTAVGSTDGQSVLPLAWGLAGRPDGLVAVGARFFFSLRRSSSSELWGSDGTATGTRMLRRFADGTSVAARVRALLPLGARRVVFTVDHDPDFGAEVWQSDGTSAGTRVLADLNPGPGDSTPRELALVDGRLFIVADAAGLERRQLYTLDVGASSTAFGPGVAATGFVARLRTTDPVRGGNLDLAIDDAPPSRAGVLLIGRPARPALALAAGAYLYVDPGFRAALPINADAAGRFRLRGTPVPTHPALAGFRLVVQAGFGPTTQPPLGLDLTDAVLWVPW